jgi:pilus assembly protein CpaB
MRGRTFFLLGIAVGLCGVPFACKPFHRPHGYNLVPVVVVAVDVPAGTVLTFDMISQRSVPEQFVTSSVVKPDSASYVVNQRVVNDLQAGDPVRWSDFGRQRTQLKPNTRLFTIELPAARALHGQLFKDDHVDILAALTDPATGARSAQTLIQNVLVLDVQEGAPLTSVRVLVTPEESEKLLAAQEVGTLSLSLRGPEDTGSIDAHPPTTAATLLAPPSRGRCNYPLIHIRGIGPNGG